MTESNESAPLDIEGLVEELRARVESRRTAGEYPDRLEDEMSAHFQRLLHQRRESRPLPDIAGPVEAAREVLPIKADKIPLESGLPGGQALHKAVAKVVGRQTEGALQQVQAFALQVQAALEALTAAVTELDRRVNVELVQSVNAIYERQAAQERAMVAAGMIGEPQPEG